MQPHNQSSSENVTPSSGTYPLAYYLEVPPWITCHFLTGVKHSLHVYREKRPCKDQTGLYKSTRFYEIKNRIYTGRKGKI